MPGNKETGEATLALEEGFRVTLVKRGKGFRKQKMWCYHCLALVLILIILLIIAREEAPSKIVIATFY